MQIEVGNRIVVREPMFHVKQWCDERLVLDNPDYYKKERLGKWTGNTPRKIYLYETNGNDLILPFGCLSELWARFGAEASFKPIFRRFERVLYESDIRLYPYQEKAVEAILEAKNGVVVMPCGAGKTQTAIEAIARIGGKTLWLTHTQDLLNQSMNRAKSVLGIDEATYGTITGGRVRIGRGITFATVQTMAKIDLNQYKDTFDVIVVDECHKAIGSPTKVMQFYKVLSNLSARYKIGLTATPKRADGLERSMFALIGDIICEVSRDEVKDTTCPVKVAFTDTGYMPDYDVVLAGDGTINYASLVNDLIHNESRRSVVEAEIVRHMERGGMIVLANRIEYLSTLEDDVRRQLDFKIKCLCLSNAGNSKRAKAVRKEALRMLNDGEINCIFATYQLAKEGLDVPNLRTLVLATPEKNPTTIEQSIGRVGRKADGKSHGMVIDFVDDFGMYKGWWKKRLSVYKKIGCDIIE